MKGKMSPAMANDLAMAGFVVGVIALMILPLPTPLIDALLAINLSLSVLLLMTALFIPSAVSLSTFPSLLLFTTLFRLALNIASTKAILLHADAGHLIESFGQLVVGGNLVVGLVVFFILVVIQFAVITSGAGRIECHVLPFSYRHLSPLVGERRSKSKGAEEGEDSPAPSRPPHGSSIVATDDSAKGARQVSA